MSAIWLIVTYSWHDQEVQGWLLMSAISGLIAIVANNWDINGNSE